MTATVKTTQSESRNGSIRRPVRGAAVAMWDKLDAAKSEVTSEHLPKLAEQQDWNLALLKFHFREWAIYSGKATRRVVTATAPAAKKAAPAKKANGKAAVKKVKTKKAAPAKTAAAA